MRKYSIVDEFVVALLVVMTITGPGSAQPQQITDDVVAWTEAEFTENLKKFADTPSIHIDKGLIADRKNRTVELLAVATGIEPGMPVEFWVVAEGGKDYEAIAVTPVIPLNIHKALEFIGMKPGRAVDYERGYFWPKGERVILTFTSESERSKPNPSERSTIRAEDLIIDTRTGQPLRRTGFSFVGADWDRSASSSRPHRYIADMTGEIITNFNSNWTILDVPYRIRKEDIYGRRIINPAYRYRPGQKLRLTLTPEFTDGQKRVIDLNAHVSAPETVAESSRDAMTITVSTSPNGGRVVAGDFVMFVDFLERLVQENKDPFITISFSKQIVLSQVQRFCRLLRGLTESGTIRIEPHSNHLYYEAFTADNPPADHTVYSGITVDLRITEIDGKPEARGVFTVYGRNDRDSDRSMPRKSEIFDSIVNLRKIVDAGRPWPTDTATLIAPNDLNYGKLLRIYQPLKKDFPIVYIHLN